MATAAARVVTLQRARMLAVHELVGTLSWGRLGAFALAILLTVCPGVLLVWTFAVSLAVSTNVGM